MGQTPEAVAVVAEELRRLGYGVVGVEPGEDGVSTVVVSRLPLELPVFKFPDELGPARQIKRRAVTRTVARTAAKSGRNDPCPCGGGKKYKVCCRRPAP